MKNRWITLLAVSMILGGCGSKPEPEAPSASAEPPAAENTGTKTPEPSAEPQTAQPVSSEELRGFQSELEPYEDLEIAFLGTISMDRSLDDILARAKSMKGCEAAGKIDDSRIFYGDRGEYTDNVYLLVPAMNTDLKIGRYNWYAGEITETWVEETEALPLIYVEDGDLIDPPGRIEYVRHLKDGDNEGFLFTGIGLDGKLRTAYHMGVVDQTGYPSFDSSEIPFYSQSFHDTLMSYEEIADAVQKGGKLTVMEEMTWEGHAYMVYDLENGETNTLYAIRPDSEAGYPHVITSRDSGMSWETLGHG